MKVLGISAYFHDSAAALVVDGKIVAAAQEERFSRVKNDARVPIDAAAFCLEKAGLRIEDIDQVVFYEKPLRTFERILVSQLRSFPRGLGQFTRSIGKWLSKRLWLKSDLCTQLGCTSEQILFVDHHLSHAASAFLCSPFDHAAIVTVDGVGEWATTTLYEAKSDDMGTRIEPIEEIRFPDSIGLMYSAITAFLGFKVNEGEYKVMGLASYGTPRFKKAFSKLCKIEDDGSYQLNMKYFAFERSATKGFDDSLSTLLGPPRTPDQTLSFPGVESQRFADIAASLQWITEQALLGICKRARKKTGAPNLCLAGGVALNSVANSKIAGSQIFDRMFVQPAAGDAGGALGAALYVDLILAGSPRDHGMSHAFYGESYERDEIKTFLDDCAVPFREAANEDELHQVIARKLANGEVGAWFQGPFEWGPRALGARSIIADPRFASTSERVNRKIKFREAFRPFAPAVLEEEASRWFDIEHNELTNPFMLSVAAVHEEGQECLPAINHTDNSARVQTVSHSSNPKFHALLSAFRDETGVGVLLNTSMNLKGEPLCATPADAIGVFHRSDLDFLVLENCLIEKVKDSHVS